MNEVETPLVSIALAVRNEEEHIRECVEALLDQDYPHDRYKIIIADGMSEDGTGAILEELMKNNKDRIKLLENKAKLASPGLDMAIHESKADFIGIMGGHTIVEVNWISVLIKVLLESGENVAVVGSTTLTANPNKITEAQQIAMNSLFGGFRTAESKQITSKSKSDIYEVESISFAIYRKSVLLKVGLHDEKLFSGDDYEMNLRIGKKGYKLLATTQTKVRFYRRSTIKKFYKRMYEFGQARAVILKKHATSFRLYYLIPGLFVIFTFLFGGFNLITVIINSIFRIYIFPIVPIINIQLDLLLQIFYILVMGLYLTLVFLFTIKARNQFTREKGSFYLFIMYPMIHIGFGLGFLRGLFPYRKIKPQR